MQGSWTSAQYDAITARGGPLLVSAAAGSGKTAVLVERAIGLICDGEDPVDADRLLIVTYTNAAAGEMKQRISARLGEAMRENPSDVRLIRQQALLSRAAIGTIHSFCLELIRQNFQHLPISPDFVMGDEGELAVLRQDSARAVIEQFYERGGDGAFGELVELLSTGRDDRGVEQTLLRLYDFARSHPFYESWLDEVEALYRSELRVEDTLWGQSLLDYAARSADYCLELICGAYELALSDEAVFKAYGPALESDIAGLELCRMQIGEGDDWDRAVSGVRGFAFARLAPLRGESSVKDSVKSARDKCKKLLTELTGKVLCATARDFSEDMADLAPKIGVLFDLTRAFSREYDAAKSRKKRLDFSDLEHLALSLLVEREPGGNYRRTALAVELSGRYSQVMVDEYQDVNEVQDLIFTSVSDRQGNLFMVGDAKQSIYSFRLATPEIFLRRREQSAAYDGVIFPAKIVLDKNFRSRREVVGAVNHMFGMLMSRRVGDIGYAGEERLAYGADYPDMASGPEPELMLLRADGLGDDEDADSLEARLVAARIGEMLEAEYPVSAPGGIRPAKPGDFCVLLRSAKNLAPVYAKALENLGIPVWAQSAGGFLELREISMTVSLLEALDNPLLDIPLAAAMLSPLFGFTDEELAGIRLKRRGGAFYMAIVAAAGDGDEKCRQFLQTLAYLRAKAAILPADRLLLEIYALTGAEAVVLAMPMGETRRSNLMLLAEYAARYHELGYKRLGGFVGFIRGLRERGGDLESSGASGEGENAVRIMSVHRSKGLEFPIVIVAGTARRFNRSDLNRSTQLHSSFGFACMRRERPGYKQYPTVPMQAIRLENRRASLSEELRVLYVALTRAKEKLIISMALKGDMRRKLSGLLVRPGEDGQLAERAVEEAQSPADWMLMAMLHHPDGECLREMAGHPEVEALPDTIRWKTHIIDSGGEQESQIPTSGRISRESPPDSRLLELLRTREAWRYRFSAASKTPAKLSVSEIAKGTAAFERRFASRPGFMSDVGLTPAEQGTAMHKFMQFSDYRAARDDLDAEIRRMADDRYLSQSEAESLDRRRLRRFFNGKLASRIFASERVFRELRFMGELSARELGGFLPDLQLRDSAGEYDEDRSVAVQGVADCVFVEGGKAVIVDYKTDGVSAEEQLLERYAPQLEIYARILSGSLPVPVGECVIYSFALGKGITLSFADSFAEKKG